MRTDHNVRGALFALFIVLALLPSYFLLVDFLLVSGSTDAQLTASFNGAAPEDIGGFWFWPVWSVLAFVEACLLGVTWVLSSRRWLRRAVAVALVAFVVTSAFNYSTSARECRLWFAHVSTIAR